MCGDRWRSWSVRTGRSWVEDRPSFFVTLMAAIIQNVRITTSASEAASAPCQHAMRLPSSRSPEQCQRLPDDQGLRKPQAIERAASHYRRRGWSAGGDMPMCVYVCFFLTFGKILVNFKGLVLGCIEADV